MTQGSGDARMQPLYFLITTAGNDTNSICYEIHQKALDISLDELRDEYNLEKAAVESAEDVVMKSENLREAKETFVYHASRLIAANPKVGYAALLVYREIKGKEFYTKLRLNQPAASRVRHQAEDILSRGLLYFDADELHGYKSKLDETYRSEALALLDEIVKEFM